VACILIVNNLSGKASHKIKDDTIKRVNSAVCVFISIILALYMAHLEKGVNTQIVFTIFYSFSNLS
jgi:hypothetical protein